MPTQCRQQDTSVNPGKVGEKILKGQEGTIYEIAEQLIMRTRRKGVVHVRENPKEPGCCPKKKTYMFGREGETE